MGNHELMSILTEDARQYSDEAIQIARKELASRGIVCPDVPASTGHPEQHKPGRPAARIALRVLLYIVWPGVWMILYGQYGEFRAAVRQDILSGAQDYLRLYLIVSSVLNVLLFAVLIYGFVFITKKTRAAS